MCDTLSYEMLVAVKPALVLALFLISVIANTVMADAHSADSNHGGNDRAHLHFSDHDHDTSAADHSDHEDPHVHLCFHFLPASSSKALTIALSPSDYVRRPIAYTGLTHSPPVPPPTA